jgi:hypothetical protein
MGPDLLLRPPVAATSPLPSGAITGTMSDVPTDALLRPPRGRAPGPSATSPATSAAVTLRVARIALTCGVLAALFVWLGAVRLAEPFEWGALGTGHDARPYWAAAVSYPYANAGVGAYGAYLYSPAFLQVLAPIRAFPWTAFLACWEAILLVGVAALSGPVLLAPVILVALPELWGGNVTILLALAIVLGFRWPATWSFVLLTKVTPGVGLLWFAVRREWRSLAIALGATAIIIAVSAVLTADAWVGWVRELIDNVGRPVTSGSLPIPLLVRLPIAVIVVTWGARTDRRWTVPVACLLALPVIWYGSLTMLLGVIPLVLPRLATRWPILGIGWRQVLGIPAR